MGFCRYCLTMYGGRWKGVMRGTGCTRGGWREPLRSAFLAGKWPCMLHWLTERSHIRFAAAEDVPLLLISFSAQTTTNEEVQPDKAR